MIDIEGEGVMGSADILCLGEAMVEFVNIGDHAGHTLYRQGYGGDTSNAAIAAARQGASVGYISAVGNDLYGDKLLHLWHQEGLNISAVKRHKSAPTGIYFVDPMPEHRCFTYYRSNSAASCLQSQNLPQKLFTNAKILHFSGISMAISPTAYDTCLQAINLAHANGLLVSFDLNHRPQLWSDSDALTALKKILPGIDIFFPSIDEAQAITGLQQADQIIEFFINLGAHRQILKLGAQGCRIYWDGHWFNQPAYAAQALDSTGAGDAFAGAFLARFVETHEASDACRYGAAAAALAVTGHGAVAPLPFRVAVENLLKQSATQPSMKELNP